MSAQSSDDAAVFILRVGKEDVVEIRRVLAVQQIAVFVAYGPFRSFKRFAVAFQIRMLVAVYQRAPVRSIGVVIASQHNAQLVAAHCLPAFHRKPFAVAAQHQIVAALGNKRRPFAITPKAVNLACRKLKSGNHAAVHAA